MNPDELTCRSCGSEHVVRSFDPTGTYNRTKSRHVGGENMRVTGKCADCGSDDVVPWEPDPDRIDTDEPMSEPNMDSLHAIARKMC